MTEASYWFAPKWLGWGFMPITVEGDGHYYLNTIAVLMLRFADKVEGGF